MLQIDGTSPLLIDLSLSRETMAATVRSDDSGASGHAVMARAEFTVTTEDGNGGVVVQQRHNGEEPTWTRGPVVENCDEAHRRSQRRR